MAAFGAPAPAAAEMAAPTDHSVQSAGTDGISSLTWSPTANILVSSNWDGGVRCWEAQEQGGQCRAIPKAQGASRCCDGCGCGAHIYVCTYMYSLVQLHVLTSPLAHFCY
jgi:WD40 repeat protein